MFMDSEYVAVPKELCLAELQGNFQTPYIIQGRWDHMSSNWQLQLENGQFPEEKGFAIRKGLDGMKTSKSSRYPL